MTNPKPTEAPDAAAAERSKTVPPNALPHPLTSSEAITLANLCQRIDGANAAIDRAMLALGRARAMEAQWWRRALAKRGVDVDKRRHTTHARRGAWIVPVREDR